MRKMLLRSIGPAFGAAVLAFAACPAAAQDEAKFQAGPVFTFGKVTAVDSDLPITPRTELKALFTGYEPAKPGEMNNEFNNAARFINMNVAAGVPEKNVHVAIVLHGGASWDVVNDAAYGRKNDGKTNGSAAAIADLVAHGVQIYVCGQSAAFLGIEKKDLLPGVKLALSAMDAAVLLQAQGYQLVP